MRRDQVPRLGQGQPCDHILEVELRRHKLLHALRERAKVVNGPLDAHQKARLRDLEQYDLTLGRILGV